MAARRKEEASGQASGSRNPRRDHQRRKRPTYEEQVSISKAMRRGKADPGRAWAMFERRWGSLSDRPEKGKAAKTWKREFAITREAELAAGHLLVLELVREVVLGNHSVKDSMALARELAVKRGHRFFDEVPMRAELKQADKRRHLVLAALADPKLAFELAADGKLPIDDALLLLKHSDEPKEWKNKFRDLIEKGRKVHASSVDRETREAEAAKFHASQKSALRLSSQRGQGKRQAGGILWDGKNAADK